MARLSSPMERCPKRAPQSEREREESRHHGGDAHDGPVPPSRGASVEPVDTAATLEGHHLAQQLRPLDDVGRRKRVAFRHESIAIAPDDAVEEQSTRRGLVAY